MKLLLSCLLFSGLAMAKTAPPFSASLLGGGKVDLKGQLKPKRHLLLSFWASWCSPCIEELGSITKHMKAEPNVPLDLLTVNVDKAETASDVNPTLKLYKFNFPVILDPKHEIFGRYQEAPSLPYSVLINPAGEIVATYSSYDEGMFSNIQEIINGQKSS